MIRKTLISFKEVRVNNNTFLAHDQKIYLKITDNVKNLYIYIFLIFNHDPKNDYIFHDNSELNQSSSLIIKTNSCSN